MLRGSQSMQQNVLTNTWYRSGGRCNYLPACCPGCWLAPFNENAGSVVTGFCDRLFFLMYLLSNCSTGKRDESARSFLTNCEALSTDTDWVLCSLAIVVLVNKQQVSRLRVIFLIFIIRSLLLISVSNSSIKP